MIRARLNLLRVVVVLGLTFGGCDAKSPSSPSATAPSTATLLTAQRYVDAGQFDQADAILVSARSSWPADPKVHELLARVDFGRGLQFQNVGLMDRGEAALTEALAHWTTACELVPGQALIRVSAGDVAAMIGRTDEARAMYAAALQLDPTSGRAALCLAQIEMDKDPEYAGQLLQQAMAHAGDVPEVHASLALLHARNNAPQAARTAIARAVELGPDLPPIRVMQARIERLLGNPTRAVEVISALGTKAAQEKGVAWEAAACWNAVERPDRAAEAWVVCFMANAHRSDAGAIAANAAEAFESAGDPVQAQTWWRQARLLGVEKQAPQPSNR